MQFLARAIVVLSALLCLLLSAAWVRSHYRWDTAIVRYGRSDPAPPGATVPPPPAQGRSRMLLTTTENGRFLFARMDPPYAVAKAFDWNVRPARPTATFSESGALPGRYGFGYQWFGRLYRDVTMVPFWFPVLLTGLLPALGLLRLRR